MMATVIKRKQAINQEEFSTLMETYLDSWQQKREDKAKSAYKHLWINVCYMVFFSLAFFISVVITIAVVYRNSPDKAVTTKEAVLTLPEDIHIATHEVTLEVEALDAGAPAVSNTKRSLSELSDFEWEDDVEFSQWWEDHKDELHPDIELTTFTTPTIQLDQITSNIVMPLTLLPTEDIEKIAAERKRQLEEEKQQLELQLQAQLQAQEEFQQAVEDCIKQANSNPWASAAYRTTRIEHCKQYGY